MFVRVGAGKAVEIGDPDPAGNIPLGVYGLGNVALLTPVEAIAIANALLEKVKGQP